MVVAITSSVRSLVCVDVMSSKYGGNVACWNVPAIEYFWFVTPVHPSIKTDFMDVYRLGEKETSDQERSHSPAIAHWRTQGFSCDLPPRITVIIYHRYPGVGPKYITFIHPKLLYGRCPWMRLSDLKQSASEYLSESSNGTPMSRTFKKLR